MSVWTQPSPSDFDRWRDLIIDEGYDPGPAARELDYGGSATFKRADPERHAEILEMWRERQQTADRRTARDTLREIASSTVVEPKDRNRAAELLGKASGYLSDRVEVTGSEGGPVQTAATFDIPVAKLARAAQILKEARDGDAAPDPVHPA